jgi:U2-associated protein SR140
VFEHLEQLPAQLEMGRMTERSYRDEVNTILKVWQDEHLFDESTLNHLDEAFNARERQKEEEEQARRLAERRKRKGNVVRKVATSTGADEDGDEKMDIDEEEADEDVAGEADQTPQAATPEASAVEEAAAPTQPQGVLNEPTNLPAEPEIPGETAAARARRLRPRAEDMFASDEE